MELSELVEEMMKKYTEEELKQVFANQMLHVMNELVIELDKLNYLLPAENKNSRLQQVINHIKQEKENLDMIIKNIEDEEIYYSGKMETDVERFS